MENYDLSSLREWAPLTEVLEKIPVRVQKGIFSSDLNVTCIDVVPEFLALGTNAGIVFWYNRFSGDVQKLRSEVTSTITCVKIVSSVEYMVAAGSANGQVSVFQIQKELPPDLNLVAPLTKSRPIERYTIRDLHQCPITCCEWSKNGMKLFSGDKQGVVVLTEFDYQSHLSKSIEILNEAYDIVQLSVNQSNLVVSTTYRSIVCQREQNNRWRVSQIGKKDRKVISNFGATFLATSTKSLNIICARPGLRFWISDSNGNVEQTLLFKDALTTKPNWDIPLLNPSKNQYKMLINFGIVVMYMKKYVLTHDESVLYILNLEDLKIEAIARGFRKILNVAVNGKEIFVLEGPRSLVRICTSPEPPNKSTKIIFNPMLPPPLPIIPTSPVEFEAEDEAIINAEECFELPPIEQIDLDIPIQVNLDSPTTQKNKAIIEQNKRIEVFDKINDMEFEESILFKSGSSKKHKKVGKKSTKREPKGGIVEIGQVVAEDLIEEQNTSSTCDASNIESAGTDNKENQVSITEQNSIVNSKQQGKIWKLTTKPLVMDASFCTNSIVITQTAGESSIEKESDNMPKRSLSSDGFIIDKNTKLFDDLKKSKSNENNLQTLSYPVDYTITAKDKVHIEPCESLNIISTELDSVANLEGPESCGFSKFSEDILNSLAQPDSCSSNLLTKSKNDVKMSKSLQFVHHQPVDTPTTSITVPDLQQVPEYMHIPTLWNVKIEKTEESDQSESHSSDWEIL